MSRQESVFLSSNGVNQFQDMMSQSSAPNWSKVTNENGANVDGSSKKLMSEINHILSDVRRDASIAPLVDGQTGGKRKKKSSKSAKASKASKAVGVAKPKAKAKAKSKSKSKSKKASMKRQSKNKKVAKVVEVVKPKAKAKSKSKSKSKKQKGGDGKKEMNPAMKNMRKLADFIKTEIPDLKDGAPMTSTASKLIKKHGGVDEAMNEVKKNKSAIKKLYNEVAKEQKENREKKKADKAKAKAASSSSQ